MELATGLIHASDYLDDNVHKSSLRSTQASLPQLPLESSSSIRGTRPSVHFPWNGVAPTSAGENRSMVSSHGDGSPNSPRSPSTRWDDSYPIPPREAFLPLAHHATDSARCVVVCGQTSKFVCLSKPVVPGSLFLSSMRPQTGLYVCLGGCACV